jgi:uncharacterized protein (UPF0261 family)
MSGTKQHTEEELILLKNIVIIVTLDTKAEAATYLKELILSRGYQAFIIDIGCGGEPKLEADITAAEVALAAGAKIENLRRSRERDKVTRTMIEGAMAKLSALCRAGQVEGMVSIGGMSSAVMASSIMKELPYRIPKLIFTSAASLPSSYRLFGPTGITVMHSLVEVGSLNRLLRGELARAAGAICGMAEAMTSSEVEAELKPMVAMSTNGWVENCAQHICKALENEYEVVRYHATGLPEVVMEKLVEENYFRAVIDLVPSSITNERYGGSRISWPRRLEVAGEKGIPQVVAPCLVGVISRTRDTCDELASEIKVRKHYFMDGLRILLWLNAEELKSMAPVYAEKLNKAVGPTKFLIPMRGWLSIETEDSEFYDLKAIQAFAAELKDNLKPEVEVIEVDANIDDPVFARAVIAAFEEVVRLKDTS